MSINKALVWVRFFMRLSTSIVSGALIDDVMMRPERTRNETMINCHWKLMCVCTLHVCVWFYIIF